ncbi:serine/threonine-protein kinase Nek10 isoform X2 [Anguilla anguilla]|uniref:serine/threonine-protein kinase Nek10 isoform X2 n=1 Tax=Anguilla anguilla TaxID=7936 RepID=UPI0015AAC98C|nr:serine/threonine-protein kinase Nek10 isoform X2 [Anguilla anguilla]
MPNTNKKGKQAEKLHPRSNKTVDREIFDLRKLLSYLTVSQIKQAPAASSSKARSTTFSKSQSPVQRNNDSRSKAALSPNAEASELENFSVTYRNHRSFSGHPQNKLFLDIFTCLVRNRLMCCAWIGQASPGHLLRILICLRLLMREPLYQKVFYQLQGIGCLAQYMESVSRSYLDCEEHTFAMEQLVNMTYMFQKLSVVEEQRKWVIECGAHKTLVKLLATRDSSVLLGSLLALTSLAESPDYKEKIGELLIVENLLIILQEYDLLSKRIAAELLRLLCPDRQVREQVKAYEGVPVLLSLLHSEHLKLLWNVVWVLVQLCEDPDSSAEIRAWGGVQQLLRILDCDRVYVSDRSSVETLSSANVAGRIERQLISEELSPRETQESTLSLQAACCAALTELVLDDTTAHHVVEENGVYVIGKLILPHDSQTGPKAKSVQCYAFRALRFLFSRERNRHLFKRLFSPNLFEMFIDIGHYVRDITAYEALQEKVSLLSDEELSSLKEGIETVNQNRAPLKVINGYAVLDHLGSGAFGSVFKVRKQSGQNLLALKEVNLHNPAFGKDKKDRDSSVEKIVSELTIIKEQMTHPNIVRYYKTFLENDRLYIIMELIEGIPLAEHFTSLKEKGQQFTEERIWNIFIQMCLALRYLHKEKRIVHRDLTPNNVMLGERDKVTITDFGLAKQKQENSKLMSVVGTILYSCPEIVKSEPYGEKADVWATGCILYQMATLHPPFYSSNMLSLATKIVEGVYEPVVPGLFSERVTDIIKWCLTPDPDLRPDIVEVSSRISDIMMKCMDALYASQHALERKLERDRKRAQKYFLETNRGGLCHCHSSHSQAFCMKDHSLSSSGPAIVKSDSIRSSPSSSLPNTVTPGEHGPSQEIGSEEELDASDKTSTSSPCSNISVRSIKRSVSASVTEEPNLASGEFAAPKLKPRPVQLFSTNSKAGISRDSWQTVRASAGICVSQRKVRQIDDPIQRLLVLLHKIIFISQLPPALQHNFKRRAIERFKKSLFHYRSSPYNLKVELKKLLQGSPEVIEPCSSSTDWFPLVQSFGGKPLGTEDQGSISCMNHQDGVTYEQMQTIIEEVLEESGYYSTTQH